MMRRQIRRKVEYTETNKWLQLKNKGIDRRQTLFVFGVQFYYAEMTEERYPLRHLNERIVHTQTDDNDYTGDSAEHFSGIVIRDLMQTL